MPDNSIKSSALPTAANVAASDRILVLRDPSGTPSLRTVNLSILSANLIISNSVPANSSANGIAGTIRLNSNDLYVCIANNTWKKITLESF